LINFLGGGFAPPRTALRAIADMRRQLLSAKGIRRQARSLEATLVAIVLILMFLLRQMHRLDTSQGYDVANARGSRETARDRNG